MTTGEMKNQLPKRERLYLKRDLERLFASGQSFIAYPLRVVYCSEPATDRAPGVAILASAPKRRVRHAVDRNRIKRLIREAYRTRKTSLTERCALHGRCLHIGFMYVGSNLPTHGAIEKAMHKAVSQILQKTT